MIDVSLKLSGVRLQARRSSAAYSISLASQSNRRINSGDRSVKELLEKRAADREGHAAVALNGGE